MFLKCKIDFFLFLPKGMITLMWKKFWRREMRRDESWKKANFDGGIWSVIFPKSGKEIPQRRMVDHTKTEIPWRVIVHYHRIIQKVNRTRAFVGVPTCLMVQSFPLIHFFKSLMVLRQKYFYCSWKLNGKYLHDLCEVYWRHWKLSMKSHMSWWIYTGPVSWDINSFTFWVFYK